jgi:hypothetical protein
LEENRTFKRKQKNNTFLYLLIGGFLLILIISLTSLLPKSPVESKDNGKNGNAVQQPEGEKIVMPAIIVGKDINSGKYTLRGISDGQDINLSFIDSSISLDKYGKNVTAEKLKVGEMVEATYNKETSEIISLQIWDKAWRYQGISNWGLDGEDGSIRIADKYYQYADYLLITRDGEELTLEELDTTDELLAVGYEKKIYSLIVTKGHGTLKFTDYEDFIGGTAYIGKRAVLAVEEDMVVTVREGEYEITLEKGRLTGTKTVKVVPEEEVEVNMGEFKLPPVQTAMVTLHVSPEGADLYVDGKEVSYTEAIELDYGKHSIKATLGGYKEYSGIIDVQEEEKELYIKLAAADNSSEESTAGEENPAGEENSNTDSGNNGTSTDTDNTNNNGNNSNNSGNTGGTSKKYVYIQTPEGASVYVNGEFKGIAPVSYPKTTGQQYITLIQSGYNTKTYTVEVKDDGEDVKLNFPGMEASN